MSAHGFDVFLSHAHNDIEFVRELAQWLRACGFKIWLAEEQLVPGSRFRAGLEQGLRESRDLLAVLTPDYFARPWTQRELDLFDLGADLSDRRVFGVQIGHLQPSVLDQVFHVSQRIPWKDGAFDPEGMWLLHCGLMRRAPGPKAEWANNGSLASIGRVEPKRPVSNTVFVDVDEPWLRPNVSQLVQSLTRKCFFGEESEWRAVFAELQRQLQMLGKDRSDTLMRHLWAIGRAEQAAIMFACRSVDGESHYGIWALLDAGCNSAARGILISQLIEHPTESEIWFSWGICDMAWASLPAMAAKAHAGPLRDHFTKLAIFAQKKHLTFEDAEADYDYGVMITPWNHFHLTWLAVRLDDLASARAHVRTLCETALQGDIRTGRFLTRICNWPIFRMVVADPKMVKSVATARASLGLDPLKAIVAAGDRLERIWIHANRSQT